MMVVPDVWQDAATADKLQLSVWSDYVCPFCYLELPELDRLQNELGDEVEIEWRAFELRPEPQPTLDPGGDYLHRLWNASVYPMAAERGMTLRLPPVQPRSRKALEAAEFAKQRGRFDAMHRALFRAFFEHGLDIGDLEVLQSIAASCGLDPAELKQALVEGRFTGKIAADQALASELRIGGVPATLVQSGEKGLLMPGAQPFAELKRVVERLRS